MTAVFKRAQQGLIRKFTVSFPGKSAFNLSAITAWVGSMLLVLGIVLSYFLSLTDTSRLSKSSNRIDDKWQKGSSHRTKTDAIKGISQEPPAKAHQQQRDNSKSAERYAARVTKINYRAKQVIERNDYTDPGNTLPTGTEMVGRLVTSIDTRNAKSLIKIELPFGGSFQGTEILPRASTLFAMVSYDGNGEKVFLDIQSGEFPDGQEFHLRAQALSAKDFSPGVEGDYHGAFTNRIAANLALSFVASLADTLTEKEGVGGGGAFAPSAVTPKATVKNGMLAGLSHVADTESKAMANELAGQKGFVTVDSGKELIVSLLERFVKGGSNATEQKGR